MDAEKRMNDLINVTTRLIDVLEREQEILKEGRHSDLSALMDEKETIGRVYQARAMGLQKDPDQLSGAPEELRDTLRELALRVDRLVYENSRMIDSAMKASKRIVELVAEALQDRANAAGTYSNKGSAHAPRAAAGARSSTISLDQTL